MEDVVYSRLCSYIKSNLGNETITIDLLSKITVLIVEFVDSFNNSKTETLTGSEKHLVAMKWIDRFIFDYCDGKTLASEVKKLNSEFISRICEISKGGTTINGIDKKFAAALPKMTAVLHSTVVSESEIVPLQVQEPPTQLSSRKTKKTRRTVFGCVTAESD